MVDMVEITAMGVLIVMVEITPESDTEMMIAMHMSPQREQQIMNPGETLIKIPDRRRIHDSVRVVILMMMRKMIGREDLSNVI
ncbi:hypothetical protein SLEP1_g6684 [Rubroshorea leprosula]|uniref:Uncharacterized protein n=1 Tax=Rubroshorea leprosula TaxID=152421 RepID=A0AAV5I1Z7_9ROSI|nr:hypothetical protein SLEP1_g6684 [Rubroshorea leprosula]